MLRIEQAGPKEWSVFYEDEDPIKIFLAPSSITNKFFIVTKFIERVAEHHGEEFSQWFVQFLKDCQDDKKRPQTVVDNVQTIKNYVDSYIDESGLDYSQFVDLSKAKKSSILFLADEIKIIMKLSCYLKVYAIIFNSETKTLGQRLHKDVYNLFAGDIIKTDVVKKIFDVVKTKTFRYNLTDKFMWEYIKNVQGKDIGSHVIEIFNFIMNYILVLCEENKNPITYFVGVIDESVKWFLRSVYKSSIVYDDTISTEDIQGINVDNLKTYSYNDTLGRLKDIAYKKAHLILYKVNAIKTDTDIDDQTIEFNQRAKEIQFVSPLTETIVYPILSRITDIPYHHLKTLSPEHSTIISIYIQDLFHKIFSSEYKNMVSLMNYFPKKNPSVSTTYKIKSIHDYVSIQQNTRNFFGYTTMILPHTMLCHFIGRASRVDFCDLLTGKELGGIPLSKIESDMILFFTRYFSGELDPQIQQMTKLVNADF